MKNRREAEKVLADPRSKINAVEISLQLVEEALKSVENNAAKIAKTVEEAKSCFTAKLEDDEIKTAQGGPMGMAKEELTKMKMKVGVLEKKVGPMVKAAQKAVK